MPTLSPLDVFVPHDFIIGAAEEKLSPV